MMTIITLSNGAIRMSKQNVIVKNLSSIQNLGQIDTLCSDKTGTLSSGIMTLESRLDPFGAASDKVFLLAYLDSLFQTGVSNPLNVAILETKNANPLDLAILNFDHPDVKPFTKLDEIPFDFERRCGFVLVA